MSSDRKPISAIPPKRPGPLFLPERPGEEAASLSSDSVAEESERLLPVSALLEPCGVDMSEAEAESSPEAETWARDGTDKYAKALENDESSAAMAVNRSCLKWCCDEHKHVQVYSRGGGGDAGVRGRSVCEGCKSQKRV